MKLIRSKKAGAELILEVLLATVIFFIFVGIIFLFLSPQLKLKAVAHIQSVDSTLQCDTSLMNFMRFEKDGITYSDLLVNSYVKSLNKPDKSDLKEFYDDAITWFGNVYGTDKVNISISDPFNGYLYGSETINATVADTIGTFNCSFYVPLPGSRVKKDCAFLQSSTSEYDSSNNRWKKVAFEIRDVGYVNVTIANGGEGSDFGLAAADLNGVDSVIDYETQNIMEEGKLASEVQYVKDTSGIDSIVVPLMIPRELGQHYELYLVEDEPDSINPQASVTAQLRKRGDIQDCSIIVTLTIPGYKRYGSYEEYQEAQEKIGQS
jgi:hypothetical protein